MSTFSVVSGSKLSYLVGTWGEVVESIKFTEPILNYRKKKTKNKLQKN